MKKLKMLWFRLSARQQVCIHLITVLLLLCLIYILLGCPAFRPTDAFRRAERAAMVGPSTVIGQFRPEGYDCNALVLGQDPEGVYLYVMHRWNPEKSELIYQKKEGSMTLLAAPGNTLFQYETRARIPLILYDSAPDAHRAELDLTLHSGDFEKTYYLIADRESSGYFYFDLVTQSPGSLGEEGNALRLLQEICSNSMAGNPDITFPAVIRFYDGDGKQILEQTVYVRSAAAQQYKES